MALDLKSRRERIHADVRPLRIPVGDDESINVTYRRASMTARDTRQLNDMVRDAKKAEKNNDQVASTELSLQTLRMKQEQLLRRVASWDVTNGGAPVPLTMSGLEAAEVDHDLIDLIIAAIQEDEKPSPTPAPR